MDQKNGCIGALEERYLYKKNTNTDPKKRSRSLFAEAVNEVCVQNEYIRW